MRDPFQHATLGVGVFYRDPWAALEWLERAFGFRRSMLVTDPSGRLVHSEMRFADAYIVVDHEWADDIASPVSAGGRNTQRVYLKLSGGLDAHCEQARRAGAVIVQEPADQFYGERTYRARSGRSCLDLCRDRAACAARRSGTLERLQDRRLASGIALTLLLPQREKGRSSLTSDSPNTSFETAFTFFWLDCGGSEIVGVSVASAGAGGQGDRAGQFQRAG